MGKFYHITRLDLVNRILEEGLKPASVTGNSSLYKGTQLDPNYVYLWKDARYAIKDASPRKNDILEVTLPEDFPIERDYEQFLIWAKFPEDVLKQMIGGLPNKETLVRSVFQRLGGIDFSGQLTDENIRQHVDKISAGRWDEVVPSYRTRESIDAKCLKLYRY